MNAANAPATVRISGPPNSSFLVGYPGISATLVGLASPSPFFVSHRPDERSLGLESDSRAVASVLVHGYVLTAAFAA